MRLEAFDFVLPAELIAQRPVEPREAARLLHVADELRDLYVRDLPSLLSPNDLLVLNDTRVLPTRFWGRRAEAGVEVTLIERQGASRWWALAKPGRRLRPGDTVHLAPGLVAGVESKDEWGRALLAFEMDEAALLRAIEAQGAMPLPPYIRREKGGDARDHVDYQSAFARRDGSVAAPTASLHLTNAMLDGLAQRGVRHTFLTLHVGAGTFMPVKSEDVASHVMHEERFEVSEETARHVNETRRGGGRIVAVGTTALRTLESAADADGCVRAQHGATRLFITPGYGFRVVDRLMTNFHLPKSTLFMLVSGFAGLARMQAAYAHAIREAYRFYSYGDACFLERAAGR